jgi:adenylate cyclase
MFLDIRDFTTFAETRPPEEVVAYQNAFFGIVIEIVNRHHGIINQFLGDGCMITFGAPLMLDNPCDNAVRAGLEIMESVPEATRLGQLPPTRVGIGIHVGDAVTGNIGTDTRQQYSITGNVVILASRIEQLNKDFGSQLLVSKEVMECLSETPEGAQALGFAHIKGRAQEVFLYKLG